MAPITERIEKLNWKKITEQLHDKGFVIVKNVLTVADCKDLIGEYNADQTYRKTINMERYRFGCGEYKYFQYPLPDLITQVREISIPQNYSCC